MVQSLREITHWNAVIIDADNPNGLRPNGIITDLECPELTREFDTTKRAGELGEVPRVKYFGTAEMSFTIKNVYPELMEALARGLNVPITLRANACIEEDDGTVTPYIVNGIGFISNLPLGGLSADGLESEITMMCYRVTLSLGAALNIDFDPRNYVLSINGTNLFAAVKTILYPPDAP